MALVAYWGALCLHTAPTETYFLSKGRNFGNTSSSPSVPLVVISNLYFVFAYACDSILLVLIALVVSFYRVHLIVILFVNPYSVYLNLLRLIKKWSLSIHPPPLANHIDPFNNIGAKRYKVIMIVPLSCGTAT